VDETAESRDKRKELLLGALGLFAARGYDAVGVTKPTLYHYFGSKHGLLQALLEDHFGRLESSLRAAAEYRRDLTATLRRVAEALFRIAESDPTYYRLQLSLWFAPVEGAAFRIVSELNSRQQRLLEALFLQAAADHGNMRGRHRAYAASFLGLVNTYIGLALNGYVQLDGELVRRAVHQFEHGIYS
jgi:AcrR family transcriptional regulator